MAATDPIFFQVGVVVDDLEAAMRELARATGLEFTEPLDRQLGEWHFRVAHSRQGPPYLELIEGDPGTPWNADGRPRMDHLAFTSSDVDAEARRLAAEGFALVLDGRALGGPWVLHDTRHAGAKIEHLDAAARERLELRIKDDTGTRA